MIPKWRVGRNNWPASRIDAATNTAATTFSRAPRPNPVEGPRECRDLSRSVRLFFLPKGDGNNVYRAPRITNSRTRSKRCRMAWKSLPWWESANGSHSMSVAAGSPTCRNRDGNRTAANSRSSAPRAKRGLPVRGTGRLRRACGAVARLVKRGARLGADDGRQQAGDDVRGFENCGRRP